MSESLTQREVWFLEAYYKACYTSDAQDWLSAALLAKQLFNSIRGKRCEEEEEIHFQAEQMYGKE